MNIFYNPIELGQKIYPIICKKEEGSTKRRVYRFRVDKWYGGILTTDVVGCNLRCRFCWAWKTSSYNSNIGTFKSPSEIAHKIIELYNKTGIYKARFSGGEPLLCPENTLEAARLINRKGIKVIIETNGLFIHDIDKVLMLLRKASNTLLRISLKGCNRKVFSETTGAIPDGFDSQLATIKTLVDNGFKVGDDFWVSAMISFCTENEVEELLSKLIDIHPLLIEYFEPEYVILYPHVKKLLSKYGLKPKLKL